MIRFKSFISEASASDATNMEKYIVIAYNGGFENEKSNKYGVSKAEYSKFKDVAEAIAKDIKRKTKAPKGSMVHFGSGRGKLSPDWLGTNATPKTDLYSTAGAHISLKQAGASQLMSGFREETISTFNAAVKLMGDDAPAETANIVAMIEPVLKNVMVQGSINNLNTAIETGKILKQQKIKTTSGKDITVKINPTKYKKEIKEFLAWKAQMQELSPKITAFFENNQKFKEWFCFEAATGTIKFSDDISKANWVTEFDPAGETSQVNSLIESNGPSPYIKKLASHTKIRISAKTNSGSKVDATGIGQTGGVLRAGVEKITKKAAAAMGITLESMINESYDNFFNVLSESNELLTEVDFFNKVKEWIVTTFDNLITKIKELAEAGINAVLEFLGWEVDAVLPTGDVNMFFTV